MSRLTAFSSWVRTGVRKLQIWVVNNVTPIVVILGITGLFASLIAGYIGVISSTVMGILTAVQSFVTLSFVLSIVLLEEKFPKKTVPVVEQDLGREVLEPVKIPPKLWANRTVVEGESYQMDGKYVVRKMEIVNGNLYVEGPWPGEKTDVELMDARKEIRQNRKQLKKWAQIGQMLKSTLPATVQAVESSYWSHMSDQSLDEQSLDSDIVKESVVEDVQGLADSIELPDDIEGEDVREDGTSSDWGDVLPDSGGSAEATRKDGDEGSEDDRKLANEGDSL
ncbi:hypothetical protein [Halorubrum sp. GN11GM_10-3_MGM]|uniref:hypothetical protein n=1 Tax=Halorubrum sp. GN11GM_10-3_MGM TaxID=2518111 RepID=UPI0010F51481|nr:hypothetical protein [Halorubrum sp. GN11GM_10-3_MGM]TKX72182.1 hypothetical protein EXE40_04890 [Halorubrum sp. GN11GM_10-3_MGM]